VINQQLAIIDPQDSRRGYFDLVFAEDEAPANTAKLLAQKQYEADKAAFDNYGVEINDDYRTEIRTPDTYISQGTTESASSVGAKITIDADSTLTRSGEDSGTSLRTRLQAVYGYPGNESRAHGLYVEVALQLRNNGGAAQARYAVSTCFTPAIWLSTWMKSVWMVRCTTTLLLAVLTLVSGSTEHMNVNL